MEYEVNTIALEHFNEFRARLSGVIEAIRAEGLRPTGLILDEAVRDLVLAGKTDDPILSDSTRLGEKAVREVCGLPVLRWTREGSARVVAVDSSRQERTARRRGLDAREDREVGGSGRRRRKARKARHEALLARLTEEERTGSVVAFRIARSDFFRPWIELPAPGSKRLPFATRAEAVEYLEDFRFVELLPDLFGLDVLRVRLEGSDSEGWRLRMTSRFYPTLRRRPA